MLGLAFCCFCHVRYDYNREFDCYVLPSNSSIGKRGLPVNFFRNCIKSKFALCLVDSVKSWLKCFFFVQFLKEKLDCQIYIYTIGYPIPSAATRFQSVRLVIVLWCLMVLILINYYSSELTSNMTITKLKPIVNSLEELAASDKLKPTIDMNSVLANRILVFLFKFIFYFYLVAKF